jgi:Fic family protein
VQNVKIRKRTRFPLQAAFDFHLRYEQIHPFENGNGRTGRLLMEKILLQNELLPMIVFKDNKEAYFNAIKKATESKI